MYASTRTISTPRSLRDCYCINKREALSCWGALHPTTRPMKQFFKFNRRKTILLLCVLAVSVLALIYLFVYIPANEKRLVERRFRAMQRFYNNVQAKADNTFQLVKSLTLASANTDINQNELKRYMKVAFAPEKKGLVFDTAYQHPVMPAVAKEWTERTEQGLFRFSTTDNRNRVHFTGTHQQAGQAFTVAMDYSASDFFGPMVPLDHFDAFIVASNNQVLLETFPSGMNANDYDSVRKHASDAVAANKKTLLISGQAYHLFVQPFSIGSNNSLIAIGLLSDTRYNAEKNQLPPRNVLTVIIIGIITLILMPWLKLFLMAQRDRLTLWDGAASFVVAMLLTSLLFFLFARWGNQYQQPNETAASKYLANSLGSRMVHFIDLQKRTLRQYDSLLMRHEALRQPITNLRSAKEMKRGNRFLEDGKVEAVEDTLATVLAKATDKTTHQVFWLQKATGNETINWNATGQQAPLGNLKSRRYFLEQKNGMQPYSLEHLVSWTSGTFRTVISTKSAYKDSGDHIVCLSFQMAPLSHTLLPAGFQFAVVNSQGMVLYHSDSTHNLNEILGEEIDRKNDLDKLLFAKTPGSFTSSYYGKQSNFFVQPLPQNAFELFVVVIKDETYTAIRETGVFSFTLAMLFLFFIIVAVQLLVVVLVSSRRSLLKSLGMETDWIWPTPSSHAVYIYANYFNTAVFLILIVFYYFSNFIEFLFLLLLAVCAITLFINFVFATKYRLSGRARFYTYKYKNIVALLIILALYNIMAAMTLGFAFFQVIIFQLLLIGIGDWLVKKYIIRYHSAPKASDAMAHQKKGLTTSLHNARHFVKSYSTMAMTRLLITSGLPVFFFYQHSYNYEQAMQARYRQLLFGTALQQSGDTTAIPQQPSVYTDGYWIKSIKDAPDSVKLEPNEANQFIGLFHRFRVYQSGLSGIFDGLAQTADTTYHRGHTPPVGSFERHQSYATILPAKNGPGLQLTSDNISYKFPHVLSLKNLILHTVYWGLLGVALLMLLALIVKVIRRLFALDLPGEAMQSLFDAPVLSADSPVRLVYITGFPGAGKMRYVLEHTNAEGRCVIDFFQAKLEETECENARLIVINHFEYAFISEAKCKEAASLLEQLLSTRQQVRVVIVSTMHQNGIFDKIDAIAPPSNSANRELKERFTMMLGHFTVVILPIQPAIDLAQKEDQSVAKSEEFQYLMDAEFSRLPMLQRIGTLLKDVWAPEKSQTAHSAGIQLENPAAGALQMLKQNALLHDEYVWDAQMMTSQFYAYVWQSLTAEERYLIYDLAEEGLVNISNHYYLSMLVQKGLIRRKEESGGQLVLLNPSFRNYVLTAIDKKELQQIQQSIKSEASWNEFRIPLLIVVVGVLAILMISQQQSYSRIIGYLTALAAAIPTLNTLFSILKPATQKSE